MKNCNHCGTQLLDSAVVCVKCGNRVQSVNIGISPIGTSSKKVNKKIIIGLYGICGAIGIFGGLVPAIGVLIMSICFFGIKAGLIILIIGGLLLLIARGHFLAALFYTMSSIAIIFGAMKIADTRDVSLFFQNVKNLSF